VILLLNILKSRKADGGLTLVLIVIIIVVFLGWLVNLGSKECRNNSDCGSGYYCGSDFSCHQIPSIEKTVVKNNLLAPSVIIGLAIIIAAYILKSDRLKFKHKKSEQTTLTEEKSKLKMP